MIGLDTNVLVRYISQDDPVQASAATKLVESLDEDNHAFVSLVTLVEVHWVLRRAYKLGRQRTLDVLRTLLAAAELEVQETDAVHRAIARSTGQADFPCALVDELGTLAGCAYTATFDKAAAALPGMRHVSDVLKP